MKDYSGTYYTKEGYKIRVSSSGRRHGEGYTIGTVMPLKNEQFQGAESQRYVEDMIRSGSWSKSLERKTLYEGGEKTLDEAFLVYQKARASDRAPGDTTFAVEDSGEVVIEKIGGIGDIKPGKEVCFAGLAVLVGAVVVLWYFLLANIRRE